MLWGGTHWRCYGHWFCHCCRGLFLLFLFCLFLFNPCCNLFSYLTRRLRPSGLMCVWFSQKEVITFKSLLVKQHFADGMQGFLKEASCFFCGCWLGFSPLSSILTVEQADWSCRYHSPGVEPWLIVTFWPFLDFPAKVFLTSPIPLAESGMFGWADAWDPYASPPYAHLLLPLRTSPTWPPRTMSLKLYTHRSKQCAFLGHS